MKKNNVAFANFVLEKLSRENMDLIISMKNEFKNIKNENNLNDQNQCDQNQCDQNQCDQDQCDQDQCDQDQCDQNHCHESHCHKNHCHENHCDKNKVDNQNGQSGQSGQSDFKEHVNQMTKILMELADCKKSNKDLQEKIGKSSEEVMNLKLEFKEILEKNEIKLEEEKFSLILKVMKSICPAMDTFSMAKISCGNDKNMLYGIEMIEKQILDSFNFFGVNKLELQIGDEFDEKNCEALETVSGDEDNRIKKIVTYPLFFKGKLLIPGKVIVSKKV